MTKSYKTLTRYTKRKICCNSAPRNSHHPYTLYKMSGYDVSRFVGEVSPELVCNICQAVMRDPVELRGCEHAFCRMCIGEWVTNEYEGDRAPTCPIDRRGLEMCSRAPHLRPGCVEFQDVSRIVRNILSSLQIKCDFEQEGCAAVLHLENLSAHVESCAYNKVMCHKVCGLYILKHGKKEHNCVAVLRDMVQDQNDKITAQNDMILAQNDVLLAHKNIFETLNNTIEAQNVMIAAQSNKIKAQNEKVVNIEKWIEEVKESRRLAEERSYL